MTYATAIPELFERFPAMREKYNTDFDYMGREAPSAYSVFSSILIPSLANALNENDLRSIISICAYLEDVAVGSVQDGDLATLLRLEFGSYLGWVANEQLLSPWLGTETRRVCGYVPGLATQRRALRAESNSRSLRNKVTAFMKNIPKRSR